MGGTLPGTCRSARFHILRSPVQVAGDHAHLHHGDHAAAVLVALLVGRGLDDPDGLGVACAAVEIAGGEQVGNHGAVREVGRDAVVAAGVRRVGAHAETLCHQRVQVDDALGVVRRLGVAIRLTGQHAHGQVGLGQHMTGSALGHLAIHRRIVGQAVIGQLQLVDGELISLLAGSPDIVVVVGFVIRLHDRHAAEQLAQAQVAQPAEEVGLAADIVAVLLVRPLDRLGLASAQGQVGEAQDFVELAPDLGDTAAGRRPVAGTEVRPADAVAAEIRLVHDVRAEVLVVEHDVPSGVGVPVVEAAIAQRQLVSDLVAGLESVVYGVHRLRMLFQEQVVVASLQHHQRGCKNGDIVNRFHCL